MERGGNDRPWASEEGIMIEGITVPAWELCRENMAKIYKKNFTANSMKIKRTENKAKQKK